MKGTRLGLFVSFGRTVDMQGITLEQNFNFPLVESQFLRPLVRLEHAIN